VTRSTDHSLSTVYLYTDGACSGNPGPGGYGVILRFGKHQKALAEGFRLTTNNRMELMAVIRGLEALKKPGLPVKVVSDSKYVVDAVRQKWLFEWEKKGWKNVKNADLWKRFLTLYRKHHITFQWIKGHDGHPENEECDLMAVAASRLPVLKEDHGYLKSPKKPDGFFT
jgi:ribonuclease HI